MTAIVSAVSEDECKETDSGAGYSGDLSRTASGRRCYAWSDLDSYVRDHLWKSHDHHDPRVSELLAHEVS